jgi:hypothetical protein
VEAWHLAGMTIHNAEQARSYQIPTRLRAVTDTAVVFEHLFASRGVLRAHWYGNDERDGAGKNK